MQAGDIEVIKDIPGYKVILKAVLKSQIQHMVEQLADHTGEESVILTASVSDGSLSHLGSESGKVFLEDHDDIKSQFLGFCLKRHHKQKQQENQLETSFEPSGRLKNTPNTGTHFTGRPRQRLTPTSPTISLDSQFSPHGIHPVSLTRTLPRNATLGTNVRHKPYMINRSPKASLNVESRIRQSQAAKSMNLSTEAANIEQIRINPNEIIKIEAVDEEESQSDSKSEKSETSNQSGLRNSHTDRTHMTTGSLPSETAIGFTPNSVTVQTPSDTDHGSEFSETVLSETAEMKFSESTLAEGLNMDGVTSGSASDSGDKINVNTSITSADSNNLMKNVTEINPETSVKVEAISEAEMDLEIIGVEPGEMAQGDNNWMPNIQNRIGFGASGSGSTQGSMIESEEQYGTDKMKVNQQRMRHTKCSFCGKKFDLYGNLLRHELTHTGERPHACETCGRKFSRKDAMRRHQITHMKQ